MTGSIFSGAEPGSKTLHVVLLCKHDLIDPALHPTQDPIDIHAIVSVAHSLTHSHQ